MGVQAMGMTSLGASAGSGVLGAVGSVMGGNSQAASDRYQAAVAMRNASLSASQADAAQAQGVVQAQSYYQQTSQREGAARAAFGANGVSMNSGSAVDVQSGIARTGAMNVNATIYNADARANSYRNQVSSYDTQANLDRTAASNAITSGWIGGATSLIGSASSVADKWNNFKLSGVNF